MNLNLVYERVLMRLKEQNEITEEDINSDEFSEEEIEQACFNTPSFHIYYEP